MTFLIIKKKKMLNDILGMDEKGGNWLSHEEQAQRGDLRSKVERLATLDKFLTKILGSSIGWQGHIGRPTILGVWRWIGCIYESQVRDQIVWFYESFYQET